jgi:hypothetical protein
MKVFYGENHLEIGNCPLITTGYLGFQASKLLAFAWMLMHSSTHATKSTSGFVEKNVEETMENSLIQTPNPVNLP